MAKRSRAPSSRNNLYRRSDFAGSLSIAFTLLLAIVFCFIPLTAQDLSDASPDNQAARRLIKRAREVSEFPIKDMRVIVSFAITNESGAVETGSFINETSDIFGTREQLRDNGDMEEFFSHGKEEATVGPWSNANEPVRMSKALKIASLAGHPKVGAFYKEDRFGPVRKTKIEGLGADCVSFSRNLRDFGGGGHGKVDEGEICFDPETGVMVRRTTDGEIWLDADYRDFRGKLVAHRVVYDGKSHYRMEATVQFSELETDAKKDFQPPSDAVIRILRR